MPIIGMSRRKFLRESAASFSTLAGLIPTSVSQAAVADGVTAPEFDRMQQLAVAYMTRWNVPGLQVAIARKDTLFYNFAFGVADPTTGSPLNASNLFRIASLSKPITAVAIYNLIEAGRLSLTSKVFGPGALLGSRYGTKAYSMHLTNVTVQHLLTHTAGGDAWVNDFSDPMFLKSAMSIQNLISWTLDYRQLTSEPGFQYAYSNFGYALLGRIIEEVTGETYHDYVQDSVLRPCGITTMEIAGNTLASRLPNEVYYFGQRGEDPYSMNVSRMDSHGGWVATATDLVAFVRRVNNFPDAPDILLSSSVTSMTTPTAANPNYAKGWQVNNYNNWWHQGSLPGTTAILVRTSGNFCWAALANTRAPGGAMELELDQLIWNMGSIPARWAL